ncbi:hypothetical protein GF373_05900 [bacterium]|nr:hypothetical protein [bacterium]
MQSNPFEETIQNTMQTCLLKMAKNLTDRFDATDPKSLRLLREFRSTLNAWKQWAKWTMQTAGKTIQSTANPKSTKKETNSKLMPSIQEMLTFPVNKETAELYRTLNPPCPSPA